MRKSDSGLVPTAGRFNKALLLVFLFPALLPAVLAGQTLEGCDRKSRLVLDLERSIPASFPHPPVSLVLLDDSNFLALDHAGNILPFGLGSGAAPFSRSLVFAGLGRHHGGALAFTNRQIFRYVHSSELWRQVNVAEEFSNIRSATGAPSRPELWMVEGSEEQRTVIRLRPNGSGDGTYSTVNTWDLPGNWRLTPTEKGEAILVSTRFPFQLIRLTEDGRSWGLGTLVASPDALGVPDTVPVYVSALTRLDCNRVLITAADLTSSHRWLFVVDARDGDVVTRAELDAALGFFDSVPARRHLFAYRDTESGGEVLIYRWTWIRQRSTP